MKNLIYFFSLSLLLLTSCGVNSNIMFKSPKGEYAKKDSVLLAPPTDYKIGIDDKISFTLSANNGNNIILGISNVQDGKQNNNVSTIEYLVNREGTVELPILGYVPVVGLSIKECEDKLEELYAAEYQKPFVQVKVTNRRVIVFPGNGGDAKVIPITNNNTTLMEVIAQAGGIAERGKAKVVKLMRMENGVRQVYTFNLSTIDGLKYSDIVVQSNDYIYIEPNPKILREVIKEVAPIMAVISSTIILVTYIINLK